MHNLAVPARALAAVFVTAVVFAASAATPGASTQAAWAKLTPSAAARERGLDTIAPTLRPGP